MSSSRSGSNGDLSARSKSGRLLHFSLTSAARREIREELQRKTEEIWESMKKVAKTPRGKVILVTGSLLMAGLLAPVFGPPCLSSLPYPGRL
jgi:folylpolyglutamate synthase/dihydropteroate synthase